MYSQNHWEIPTASREKKAHIKFREKITREAAARTDELYNGKRVRDALHFIFEFLVACLAADGFVSIFRTNRSCLRLIFLILSVLVICEQQEENTSQQT
jgi:hypothetical protein